ncbi:unnamed protein product [Calypogeia fissa]
MGLKDRAKKLVSDQLRPWLRREVSPVLTVSVSEITMELPNLEFDAEVLNLAAMGSSPLLVRKETSMKVKSVQLTFTPFRQPVLAVLVQGWHVDLEPRSADDVWWQKKKEKAAEQKQGAALDALDPQGAIVHTAAQGLAEEKGENSLISKFLTSLMLTSVRMEFRDSSLRLVSHVQSGRQHVCSIPLSSLEFGGGDDSKGFSWSGGLMGAVTAALSGIWTKNGAPTDKYCIAKGFGLLVETHDVDGDGDGDGTTRGDDQQELINADMDESGHQNSSERSSQEREEMTLSSAQGISEKKTDSYVLLFEHLVLGIRFMELAMDAMEFDAPEFAVGLELDEIDALQTLASQIQGVAQDSSTRAPAARGRDSVDGALAKRNPIDLWKRGIRKAMERTSRGRLTYTFRAGVLRSRYSSLYESWLKEVGWGGRPDDKVAERNQSKKKRQDKVNKLSEEISEIQKRLSIEAIALGRRLARHRVSAARHSNENALRRTNSWYQSERMKKGYASFQVFMASFWRIVVMSTILMQGKALGASMWMSAARTLGVREWKSVFSIFKKSENNENALALDDSQQPVSGLESSSASVDQSTFDDYTPECGTPENYFQLGCGLEEDSEIEALPVEKKKRWGMVYAFKIRRGSITLAGRPVKAIHKGEEPASKQGELQMESAMTPAVHLFWKEMVFAYGYTGNNSGTSMSCGSLGAELFSVIPAQLSQRLTESLDAEVFQQEFSSLGRWTCKKGERVLLLSSSPCQQERKTGSETISGHPLAGEIYRKHWIWQERHLESWSKSWQKPRVAQGVNGGQSGQSTTSTPDDFEGPFLIAELSNSEDEPRTEAYPGGLMEYSLALGRLDLSLKGASFICVCHLLSELGRSEKPTEKEHGDLTRIQSQSQNAPIVSLEKMWDDNYNKYLDMCRDAMVAIIPKKCMLLSAVVECPRLRLSATTAELQEYMPEGTGNRDTSGKSSKLNTEATVIIDLGQFDLALWPPEKKIEAVLQKPSHAVGRGESRAAKDLWNHSVGSKVWLMEPPASAHPNFVEKRFWEHEQVGSNMYTCIEGLALALELHQEMVKELPVFGPLAFIIESSVCSDQYSALLATRKSVSAAVNAKLLSWAVQSYITEVNVVQQVVGFYSKVMKTRMGGGDPVVVVEGGNTFLTVEEGDTQEDQALSLEDRQNSDSKEDSLSSEEVYFTACTLTFAVELENFRLVLGDSRQEDGYSSSKKGGAGKAKRAKSEHLRDGPRDKILQAIDDDDDDGGDTYGGAHDWEQYPSGVVLGREVYVLIQNVSWGVSLGDEESFCILMGMNNTFVRLVNSGSESSRSDLAKLRNDFFSASMKSFPGLVLAEAALEYFRVKVFASGAHHSILETLDFTNKNPNMEQQEVSDAVDGPELSPETTLVDLLSSSVDPTNMTVKVNSQSSEQPTPQDQGGPEQQNSIQSDEASTSNPMQGETPWLAANVEISKLLVTDGSVDVLMAKVLLVANGEENFQLHFGVDRAFQKISLGLQGGLVLVHTSAIATLYQFYTDLGDLMARPAGLTINNTSESPQENSGREARYASSVYRSASAPALSTENLIRSMKRTSSAPALAKVPVPEESELTSSLRSFEGVLFSKLTGFSLVLAKRSGIDSEGVLFEFETSTMLEFGDRESKVKFDLMRFTILGLQARGPQNSNKGSLGRTNSRTPQFGASFKLTVADVQSLSGGLLTEASSALQAVSETDASGRIEDQPKKESNGQSSPEGSSRSKEQVVAGNGGVKGKDWPAKQTASVDEQAEQFYNSLLHFNSFILEHLLVHVAVEKVSDQHQVWKWTNAWHGQCIIGGFNVAITTAEIQLLESLVAPLSSMGGSGSSKSTGRESASASATVEVPKEVTKETSCEIPDGAIIALKDVYEHCYLAAEEISTNKGHYRLVGVLHYTLAGDKALFKVKYQDPLKRNTSKDAWFSLLSLHAKGADGEPLRVHCRSGSGLADISSSKDGPWEKWRFVQAESSNEDSTADVDVNNRNNKHWFHLVNYKNRSGIAFDENVPVIVKQPGNPFKVKIFNTAPSQGGELQEDLTQTGHFEKEIAGLVNSIPSIVCTFDTFIFTVLHEAGGGLHLLPLVRLRIPGGEGVMHMGLSKTRTILQCAIVLEHFESQSSRWVSVVNPIETDLFYRSRSTSSELLAENDDMKCPVAFFSRFRKVDVVFSEPSLDAVLFLIGALDLAGPFSMRYSPVQANRCLVKNQTGLDALCSFDQASPKTGRMIPSWHSDAFLMRHMTSRRDSGPAKVASSVALYLQKSGKGSTSPVFVNLGDPGVFATKTRLQADGKKTTGPMVVVDISRRNEHGIVVTVSPIVRIRNSSGLPLELRCRRDSVGEEGAVVVLEDGDTIDDSMAAFDALNLAGELRKALASLNLGNYYLSVRPAPDSLTEELSGTSGTDANFEWSEDIKGAKPVKSSGALDKLQYNFNNPARVNLKSSFGVVFCSTKQKSSKESSVTDQEGGVHFLVRTTRRQVPVSRMKKGTENEQQQGQYSIVAWQQQQELLVLPTVRLLNLTTASISVLLVSASEGKKLKNKGSAFRKDVPISSFGMQSMYVDLGDLILTVKQEDLNLTSRPIGVGGGSKEFSKNSKLGRTRDVEMEVDFGDGMHCALVIVRRGADGVLEILFLTRYTLQNDGHANLLCCSARPRSPWWRGMRKNELEWPNSDTVLTVAPKSKLSWFERSTTVLFKRTEPLAEVALLDLESVSGSMEISLLVHCPDSVDNRIQLGVQLKVPSAEDSNPSCIILLVPRYVVANYSNEAILVCQDGFEDTNATITLAPGERSALNAQELPGQSDKKGAAGSEEVGPDILLKVRFRPKEPGWNWSGPVCAAALGSFSVKIKRLQHEEPSQRPQTDDVLFAVVDVQEKDSSLIMAYRRQPGDRIPYRIENALRSAAITYNQEGLENSEVLEAGASVGYVWDDLDEPHTLIVSLAGAAVQDQINPDKLRGWKQFRTSRGKNGLLQIPFLNDLSRMAMYGDGNEEGNPPTSKSNQPRLGYEVYADGPTRVVRICEEKDARLERNWQADVSRPNMEIDMRIPIFTVSLVEPGKEPVESDEDGGPNFDETVTYVPIICLRLTNGLLEARITPEYTFCQMKTERLDVEVKWNGAPVAAMLRGHGEDRFATGRTMLHTAIVMCNGAMNPIQLKYASVLLQAVDVNLDEETLMKLVPFYRISLSESTAPSRQIYFERFEIHPIKIVGSFLPGSPRADYSSGQETLRALLHSVIKVPTVRGATVELNGVLLSNALLTFKQLALKCAQHYSWYSMRAIYIARGSKLLPPGFASLFDDSAASSLDVFFDPSNGSVDLQGLTLGMFGMLKRGLRKKGRGGGTQRYLGDLQHTVKAAGSNILFAAVTEVSDSVLKGADTYGFDGVLSGFRRGILNVAMKPSVLRGAVVQGGSTRKIKLERIVGANEAYIEGYLQAMLDALFKQSYVRVKVMDDQVLLKNLPPNTTLMEEMVQCVRDFLIGEGLLAGESSAAALSSLRRLQGEERKLGPTLVAVCEQLLVIIVVRSLRRQTIRVLRQKNITFIGGDQPEIYDSPQPDKDNAKEEQKEQPRQGYFEGINFKNAVLTFAFSSALAYVDGRICRHIPNPLVRRVVSGFLLSFVE